MTLRQLWRAVALGLALAGCYLRLAVYRLRGPLTPVRRALWLQACCRSVLRSMGIRYRVQGVPAQRGMVVSNHLSYLDILIFSAVMPCVFVAKEDILGWPAFGFFARVGGSIFVNRASVVAAAEAAEEIAVRLGGDVPVLVFPEGTSSDGSTVLPFRSPLFQPAVSMKAPVTVAAVRYVGEREADLCWYGDQLFLPHLWKVLGARAFEAEVWFGGSAVYAERKRAASDTHALVVGARE